MNTSEFDDIRPYYDAEISSAMSRIARSDVFPVLASWIFPGRDLEDVRRMVLSFKTIKEFQFGVMIPVNRQIIERSITELTFRGFEKLNPDMQYLFVSNHRDIMGPLDILRG